MDDSGAMFIKNSGADPEDRAEHPEYGDAYTFVALDPHKAVVGYLVGKRDYVSTEPSADLRALMGVGGGVGGVGGGGGGGWGGGGGGGGGVWGVGGGWWGGVLGVCGGRWWGWLWGGESGVGVARVVRVGVAPGVPLRSAVCAVCPRRRVVSPSPPARGPRLRRRSRPFRALRASASAPRAAPRPPPRPTPRPPPPAPPPWQ